MDLLHTWNNSSVCENLENAKKVILKSKGSNYACIKNDNTIKSTQRQCVYVKVSLTLFQNQRNNGSF